jgi:hypothetical protein
MMGKMPLPTVTLNINRELFYELSPPGVVTMEMSGKEREPHKAKATVTKAMEEREKESLKT